MEPDKLDWNPGIRTTLYLQLSLPFLFSSYQFYKTVTFPGEGSGNTLQYSCLENPMGRGAWQATVHGVTQLDMTEQLSASSEQNSMAWPPSSSPWPFSTLSGTYLGTLRCWQNPGWVYSLMSGVDSHVSFQQFFFFFFRPVLGQALALPCLGRWLGRN